MLCGLVDASSVTVSVPEFVPATVGVNVTEIVQEVLAANVLGESGQFDVWVKLPEMPILAIVNGIGWAFLRVTVFAALVVLTGTLPIPRFVVEKTTWAMPVPVKLAD